MFKNLVFALLIGAFIWASGCSTDQTTSPGNGNPPTDTTGAKDTIALTQDTVAAGDTAEVLLLLSNPDSAIAALNVWVQSSSSGVVFDTAEVLSPRFPASGMEWQTVRHDSVNLVSILLFPDIPTSQPITAGNGPIMRLRYIVDPGQVAGTITLDTSSVLLGSKFQPVGISYPSGTAVPSLVFEAGRISVE